MSAPPVSRLPRITGAGFVMLLTAAALLVALTVFSRRRLPIAG